MKINTITTDMIVGFGLVIALILSIALGSGSEIQTTLGAGLVGYIGRVANEAVHQHSLTEEFTKKVSEAVLKEVTEQLKKSNNPALNKVEAIVSNPIVKNRILLSRTPSRKNFLPQQINCLEKQHKDLTEEE